MSERLPDVIDRTGLPKEPESGCDSCTACCTILAVAALNKPNFKPCVHICEAGCAIYETRPEPCRAWSCLWRTGRLLGGTENRPNELGLMFDVSPAEGRTPFGSQCIVAFEVWPGAWRGPRAIEVLKSIACRHPILICTEKGVRPAGPVQMVQAAKDWLFANGYVLEQDIYVSTKGIAAIEALPGSGG